MARARDVIENPVTGERITFLRTAKETSGELLQFELAVQPGGFPVGAHVHNFQEERFKMIFGELHVWINDREKDLGPGDELVIDRGVAHDWSNRGSEEARLIVELRPAMRWEQLFETMFGLARDGKTDRRGRPNPFQLAVILMEFKDEAHAVKSMDRLLTRMLPVLAVIGRQLGYRSSYSQYSRKEDK